MRQNSVRGLDDGGRDGVGEMDEPPGRLRTDGAGQQNAESVASAVHPTHRSGRTGVTEHVGIECIAPAGRSAAVVQFPSQAPGSRGGHPGIDFGGPWATLGPTV